MIRRVRVQRSRRFPLFSPAPSVPFVSRFFWFIVAMAIILTAITWAGNARASTVTQFCGDRVCPSYEPAPAAVHRREKAGLPVRHHRKGAIHKDTLDPNGNLVTGLVTVPTAAGIAITCSAAFASEAASLIADAVAHGVKFRRITCYSRASTHRRDSNHHTGDAFDSHPSIPAYLTRSHGLRSGCDFHDCMHVDNARNVGGMALWNSVKHRGNHYARRGVAQ